LASIDYEYGNGRHWRAQLMLALAREHLPTSKRKSGLESQFAIIELSLELVIGKI